MQANEERRVRLGLIGVGSMVNYGGLGHTFSAELLEHVPGLRLLFDTGNPVSSDDHSAPPLADGQQPKQSAWDFYRNVREHVEYVHIKDARFDSATQKPIFTWPGEGDGEVRRIVKDLLSRGYDGGFSIEPHLKVVFHEGDSAESAEASSAERERAARTSAYIEYGRRFMALLAESQEELAARAKSGYDVGS